MALRDRLRWASLGLVCAAAFLVVGVVTASGRGGHGADVAVRDAVLNGLPTTLRRALDAFARPVVIVVLSPTALLLALLALVRTRWRSVLAAVVTGLVPPLIAFAVREHPPLGISGSAFPSNHAAVALALLAAVAVLWPWPIGGRGLTVAGVVGLLTCLGNVAWYAHEPRDVVGSALLVVATAALTFAALGGTTPNLRASRAD